jgi:hypothetical protein
MAIRAHLMSWSSAFLNPVEQTSAAVKARLSHHAIAADRS